jgi:ferric iron reductase protein FhuF
MKFDEVLDGIRDRVGYLRCATAAPADDGWLACDSLIADPVALRNEIDATAVGRKTTDPQVSASLFTQSYAFRVPSIAIAAWCLGLSVPSIAPQVTAIRIVRDRPAELAITDATVATAAVDASIIAERVFDGHLAPFIASVRAGTRVGERLLWGNVAASLATIFRAVHGDELLGDPAVRARADEFFTAADPWLHGLGHWSTIRTTDSLGWYFDRTTCCLFYRADGASYCDDCSLTDPERVRLGRTRVLTSRQNGLRP